MAGDTKMIRFYEILSESDGSVSILFLTDPPRILRGLIPDLDCPDALEEDLMKRYDDYYNEAEVFRWPF